MGVIPFPRAEFILTCKHCRSQEFVIVLNSDDPFDFKSYICLGCERGWDLEEHRRG